MDKDGYNGENQDQEKRGGGIGDTEKKRNEFEGFSEQRKKEKYHAEKKPQDAVFFLQLSDSYEKSDEDKKGYTTDNI